MVIYMSEFPPWNLLTNFDLWFIVDMKIAQIYKLTWVLYYNLNIFEFIYCLCYRSWSTQSGGHWETTGVWTLSRPSMTDRWTNTPSTQADKCRSRSILLNLRNYLIIFFFRPVGILKKQKTSICLSFFMLSIIIFKTVHIVNWSAIYMYIHLCNFMNELFSTIFYLLLSLPVRLQEIIFNCFFGSQIWKNDLWYVHGRNRQTGPGEATEAWTSVRRERIRRIIHQGALLHKICFRNWKVRTSV